MIPARIGSSRLKKKNLALLNGKPLISYSINAARESNVFSKVVLNADDRIFKKIAERYGVDFYLRPKSLGTSETKSDEIVADFMRKFKDFDILVWVNPIDPFTTGKEIREVTDFFQKEDLDSLITSEIKQVHARYKDKPLNYDEKEMFALTQDLNPIQLFNYSIMMWNYDSFMKGFERYGFAFFSGKSNHINLSSKRTIIKTKEDLIMAEILLGSERREVIYDSVLD
jgi:CMP-N-acetylneuraminic acid synthetase